MSENKNPIATITMADGRVMKAELPCQRRLL